MCSFIINKMKNKTKKTLIISGISLLILGAIISVLFLTGVIPQSVLSADEIAVGTDGKTYWTFFASANKPNEQYIFTYTPTDYSYTNSTGKVRVDPSNFLTLAIKPKEPKCIYQAEKVRKSGTWASIDYYVFNNPKREMNIEIADRDSQIKTLNGATVSSLTINDPDGKGKLVIETQGLLMGADDCPSPTNVVLVEFKDGELGYYYKNDVDDYVENANAVDLIINLISSKSTFQRTFNPNSQFTSSFISDSWTGEELKGVIQFGYPTFTITADQDYFDSIIYVEPVQAKPNIVSINIPNEIKQDDSGTGTIVFSNSGENGLVRLEITSDIMSVSSYSQNFELGNSYTASFTLKAGTNIKSGNINVKVCSVSQFSTTNNCDTKSKGISIVSKDSKVDEECGNGKCEDSETNLTCPDDCKVLVTCGDNICQKTENFGSCPGDCPLPECKWYQNSYSKDKKLFGLIPAKEGCRLNMWIIIAPIVLILGLVLILRLVPRRK